MQPHHGTFAPAAGPQGFPLSPPVTHPCHITHHIHIRGHRFNSQSHHQSELYRLRSKHKDKVDLQSHLLRNPLQALYFLLSACVNHPPPHDLLVTAHPLPSAPAMGCLSVPPKIKFLPTSELSTHAQPSCTSPTHTQFLLLLRPWWRLFDLSISQTGPLRPAWHRAHSWETASRDLNPDLCDTCTEPMPTHTLMLESPAPH